MDVSIRCICPEKDGEPRHDGDTVTLKDTLDFLTATSIRKCIAFVESDDGDEGGRAAEILARLSEGYLLFGIASWTLVDEKGKPLPVSHAAIRSRILSRWEVASAISDVADDLYQGAILLPLLVKASTSSPPSPAPASTSARKDSPKKSPRPSKPSSISTTQTDGIEVTSPSLVGGSRSSPSSATAA